MFKTLIGRFTVLYWLLFAAVVIPVYLYTDYHFSGVLKTSEEEKVTLTFLTLSPSIALNLSFDQKELVGETLQHFLEHQDIVMVQLVSVTGEVLFSQSKAGYKREKYFFYENSIEDPFTHKKLATATIQYSNEHLEHLTTEIFGVMVTIFMSALVIFIIGFFYLRDDLKALARLSKWLSQYMVTKDIEAIEIQGTSMEVRTIATVANEMLRNISDYVRKLEGFNRELEQRVEEAVEKQRNQERLMIHQSRQAAMGEMLESIAHQWRQPLNNIGLAVTNMETKHAFGALNDDEFERKMTIISDNIQYMSDTIDDFRNFLTPDRTTQLFSPIRTVQDVLRIIDAQLRSDKIDYNVESCCAVQIRGIENEFKQVLLVLFNNARDAIKEQRTMQRIERGRIDITLHCRDEQTVFEVCDNGGGIDEEICHSIFEPYFTTKFKTQGTGIGLYLAKNIIENRMEGTLTMKNQDGGSCFIITVPVGREEES
jgi:signal transduction histidine kinase